MKRCQTCKEVKFVYEFTNCKPNKDGLDAQCKKCKKIYARKRHLERKQLFIDGVLQVAKEKKCYKCKEIKPAKDFYKNISCSDGLERFCRKCHLPEATKRHKKWHKKNRKHVRAYARAYYARNYKKMPKKRDKQERKAIYYVWVSMRQRCNNPNYPAYKKYGAKGIKTSEEWARFKPFKEWSLVNGYKEGEIALSRRDSSGDYTPENCIWIPWHSMKRKEK